MMRFGCAEANESFFETERESHERFELEVEFVQALANPAYLKFLAVNKYFEDPTFVHYLKYLLYWCRPEYCTYLLFPNCLKVLQCLQDESFRQSLIDNRAVNYIRKQLDLQWLYFKCDAPAKTYSEDESQERRTLLKELIDTSTN
eukprot:GHVT01013861.1.p1 GENE.GHVT01013861.1~~GHVT01013861.1.p1  ORF type:complete len:145 (+),score=4.89 GHVT01013861.1:3277-3711(+)